MGQLQLLATAAFLLFLSSAHADYLAINCGGRTNFDPSLPTYYQGVDYGWGPIYQPNNSYTSKAGIFYRTDAFYSGTSAHVSDYVALEPSLTTAKTEDDVLYRDERYGLDVYYDINLPNGNYTVEMHWAENLYGDVGKRAMSITMNGVLVEPNLDIVKEAGAWKTALIKQYPAVVTNGLLHVFMNSLIYEASVNAMRIFSATGNNILPPSPTQAFIDAGSSSDKWFVGGTPFALPAPVLGASASEVSFYTAGRVATNGKLSYFINLQNGDYQVELFFAEPSATANRTFDVALQTLPVARGLDVAALAGGSGRAYVLRKSATVPNELLRIDFFRRSGEPFVNAIRVFPLPQSTNTRVAINCGAPLDVLSGSGVIFTKDIYFSGGEALVTNPYEVFLPFQVLLDDFIYTSARIGASTYNVPVPNGPYVVELRLAEIQNKTAGQRVFNVTINGVRAFTGIDIVGQTGAKLTPILLSASTVATNGIVTIQFSQDAIINAMYIRPDVREGGAASSSVGVNCGGVAYNSSALGVPFAADTVVCNSTDLGEAVPAGASVCRYVRPTAVAGSYSLPPPAVPIAGTQDAPLYQSEFFGPVSYLFNLPNGRYNVTCLFAEIDATVKPGQRIFNIAYNNVVLQPLYEPLARAGGVANTAAPALRKVVTVTRGVLKVALLPVVPPTAQPQKISAIYVTPL